MRALSAPCCARRPPYCRWGIAPFEGEFSRREAVRLLASDGGKLLARACAPWSSEKLRQIMGLSSD